MKKPNFQVHSLKKKKCILCDSGHISELFKRDEYVMVKCRNCGLIYQLLQVSKDKYLKDVQKHYSEVDPSFKVAYSRKRVYKRFLNKIKPIKAKKAQILDIGCGWGYFLSLAKNEGWNARGLELNPDLVKIGIQNYRLDISCSDFEESNFANSFFEVITLWNVFDELPDPLESIFKIKRILKPGGILFMRTPNATFHLSTFKIQQVFKKLHLVKIMPYQSSIFHIFNFSKKTLKWILSNNGFCNIKIRNSCPTSGYPYGVRKRVGGLKTLTFLLAQCIFFLTLGKLTVAPSIEAFAENAKT